MRSLSLWFGFVLAFAPLGAAAQPRIIQPTQQSTDMGIDGPLAQDDAQTSPETCKKLRETDWLREFLLRNGLATDECAPSDSQARRFPRAHIDLNANDVPGIPTSGTTHSEPGEHLPR